MKKITLVLLFAVLIMAEKVFCQGSNTLTVTVVSNSCASTCDGTVSVNVNGGNPPYAYYWSPGGYNTQTVTGLCSDTYTVVAYDAIFDYGNATATVTCPLGIFDVISAASLTLFPSPAESTVSLDLSSTMHGDYTFKLVNIFGEVIREEQLFINRNLNKSIDVSGLPSGVYFIGLQNEDNFYSGKFLKL